MSTSSDSSGSSGVGFLGLLLLVFVTLKLCDVIGWSWWWVLSPLWGSAIVGLLALAGLLFYLWKAN